MCISFWACDKDIESIYQLVSHMTEHFVKNAGLAAQFDEKLSSEWSMLSTIRRFYLRKQK